MLFQGVDLRGGALGAEVPLSEFVLAVFPTFGQNRPNHLVYSLSVALLYNLTHTPYNFLDPAL